MVYVDDLIITGTSATLFNRLISQLNGAFALKDLGSLHCFLGINITTTKTGPTMSQVGYIHDILIQTHMDEATPVPTPAHSQSRLTMHGDPFPDPTLYRQVVGSLQYATITRPDITFVVNRVCQYMHSPTIIHWQSVKQILR